MKNLQTLVLAGLAPLAFGSAAMAADWQVNPTVQAGAMSDSNLRLDAGSDKASVSGAFARAEFEFRALTPTSDFSLTPSVDATWFPADEDEDEDYTNGALSLDWTRRGQTSQNRLYAVYEDAATVQGNRVTTDLDGGGLGDPTGGESGVLTLRNRVEVLRIGDAVRFDLSERHALELGADFQDRSYDLQVPGSDVSFTSIAANVGWRQAVSERSAFTLRGTFLNYDPDLTGGASDTLGLEAEWNRQVSERLDAYVRVGANRTQFDEVGPGVPDQDTAFVGGAGGSWRFQTARLFLDYTRNIDPNASGITVQRDQFRVRLTKDYSERFAVLAALRYISDSGPNALFNDRKYGAATLGAEYRMRRAWSVVGRYDHSWLDEELAPRSASSNAFRLSLVYKPSRGVAESGESFLER